MRSTCGRPPQRWCAVCGRFTTPSSALHRVGCLVVRVSRAGSGSLQGDERASQGEVGVDNDMHYEDIILRVFLQYVAHGTDVCNNGKGMDMDAHICHMGHGAVQAQGPPTPHSG